MNELLLQFRENLLGLGLKSRGEKPLPQTVQQEILDDVKTFFTSFKKTMMHFLNIILGKMA